MMGRATSPAGDVTVAQVKPVPGDSMSGDRARGHPTAGARSASQPGSRQMSLRSKLRAITSRIDGFASFWIVFLLLPFISSLAADVPTAFKVLSTSSILLFALLYVWCVSVMPAWLSLPSGASALSQIRRILPYLAILIGVWLGSVIVIRWWGAYCLPYLMAIVLYGTTLRVGISATVGVCSLVFTSAYLLQADITSLWTVAGCSFSCLAIMLARISEESALKSRAAQQELETAQEREAISRDIHDLLGHSLTVLTLKAEVAQRLIAVDPHRAEAELEEIISLSRTALADVRSTVTRLRIPPLSVQVAASRSAFKAAGIKVVTQGSASDIPERYRELISWTLRETTTNILRHAQAAQAMVTFSPSSFSIADDGVGLGTSACGNGLAGLEARGAACEATVRWYSPNPNIRNNRGTVVEVMWE